MTIVSDEDELLQQQQRGPLTAWTCPRCTVMNQPTYLSCDCCGEERPSETITTNFNQPPQPPLPVLDSQSTQQHVAPIAKETSEIWTCIACTFINSSMSVDCDICGTAAINTYDAAAHGGNAGPSTSRHQQHRQQQQESAPPLPPPPPPPLHIPLSENDFKHQKLTKQQDSLSQQEIYVLDCGCRGRLQEIRENIRVAVTTLPRAPSLLCLLRHFSCPANSSIYEVSNESGNACSRQLSRRDLEALLGAKAAAAIDRGFYSAATAHGGGIAGYLFSDDADLLSFGNDAGPSTSSATAGSKYSRLNWQCIQLATAISHFHSAMTTTTTTTTTTNNPNTANSTPGSSEDIGIYSSSKNRRKNQQKQRYRATRTRETGVGYGGGGGYGEQEDTEERRHLKEEAAERQRTTDLDTAVPLRAIRDTVRQILQTEEKLVYSEISPPGWLPLGTVGVLNGSPLAASLRLLLCNDSLMDVTERREVYSEALQLVSMLASRQELIPLLLVPADGDVLAQFCVSVVPSPSSPDFLPGNGEKGEHHHHHLGKNRKAEEDLEKRSSKRAKTEEDKGTTTTIIATATADEKVEKEQEEISFEAGLERSCWKALQAFSLQCKLFMRSAQQLAGDGSEDDVRTVGTVLLVQETCTAVDEAVQAWKITHNTTNNSIRENADAGNAGPSRQNQTITAPTTTANTAPAHHQQQHQIQQNLQDDKEDLKQKYIKSMKDIAFRSVDLIEGGDYYFRNQLNSNTQIQGDANARLRKVTRDISSLATDLPVDFNSSILVVNDETRMDAFRCVIFAPKESPYSSGAFFFDILVPPNYPASPPKVQFLTTGGGRVRFNPNLYKDGKVCLSLLGTWQGPSWDVNSSSLLQVVVSIQAMILGESAPYGNEPGSEEYLNSSQGKRASDAYNRIQRYNTVKYSILPAVQAVVAAQPKKAAGAAVGDASNLKNINRGKLGQGALGVPKSFEEALKLHYTLKAGEIKQQLNEWKRENTEFNKSIGQGDDGGSGGGGGNKSSKYHGNSMSAMRMNDTDVVFSKSMEDAVDAVVALLDQIAI
jgi:ubiquitin-protein ligase